jgi:hypothetical protein
MTDQTVPQPVARRADKIVVGDRIPDEYLAFRFNQGPAEVAFVAHEVTQSLPWIFVAYRYPNGQHDSMTVRPEAVLEVFPGAPVGHDYSRADDGETTQPIAGRIPPHFEDGRAVVEVGGGLIEIDPPEGFVAATAPYATFAEQREAYEREEAMRLPRCPNCRGRHHADEPCS